jgi:hypothetical protein
VCVCVYCRRYALVKVFLVFCRSDVWLWCWAVFSFLVLYASPGTDRITCTSHHGTEETSSRIAQKVGPQEEVGEAPQEVQEEELQEGGPQASQVPQEEALQEG